MSGQHACRNKKMKAPTSISRRFIHRQCLHFLIILCMFIYLFHFISAPVSCADWIDVEKFESRLNAVETAAGKMGKASVSLLDTVEKTILEDIEAKRQKLIRQVEQWNRDIDSAKVEELNMSVAEGMVIAQKNGLPVVKLKTIFELTKRIIRQGEFKIPNTEPPNKESFRIQDPFGIRFLWEFDYQAYYDDLFSYIQSEEDAIAAETAEQQGFRVHLYKRATLAFLKSLLASNEAPGKCTGSVSPTTLTVNGNEVPSTGCFDPVVEHLKDYMKAIQKISSADADVLMNEAEMLAAYQQYAADVMAGVPVVGDFLDVYAVYAGENIAGLKLSDVERGFTAVLLALPVVGPVAGEIILQGARRVPGFEVATTVITDTLSYLLKRSQESTLGMMAAAGREAASDALQASYKAYQATAKMLAKEWDVALDSIDGFLVAVGTRSSGTRPSGTWVSEHTRFLTQNLEQGSYARRAIADLPDEVRIAARFRSQEVVEGVLGKLKRGRQASGIVEEHMEAMLAVARNKKEIYIFRPVNPKATKWIQKGYSTKPMAVKSKSASRGPFAALIPVDPHLNKIGSKLDDAEAALRSATDAADIGRIRKDMEALRAEIKKAQQTIADCRAKACAKEVAFTLDGIGGTQTVHRVTGPTGEVRFAVLENGKWLDADALESGRKVDIGFIPKDNQPVLVLADENGIPYTADYDFLNFAENKPHAIPKESETTGFITEAMEERLEEVNEATRRASQEGRDVSTRPVSHHGAESLNPYTPGVDYPLTVIDGRTGDVFVLPMCDADCMKAWCETTKRCDPLAV
ncbi:MAG: hypothetical protein FJ122_15825, partial [Deltaproteobacteria bacterium]|nr:hypothetical protein [Deltaproteobacteria bacterium]